MKWMAKTYYGTQNKNRKKRLCLPFKNNLTKAQRARKQTVEQKKRRTHAQAHAHPQRTNKPDSRSWAGATERVVNKCDCLSIDNKSTASQGRGLPSHNNDEPRLGVHVCWFVVQCLLWLLPVFWLWWACFNSRTQEQCSGTQLQQTVKTVRGFQSPTGQNKTDTLTKHEVPHAIMANQPPKTSIPIGWDGQHNRRSVVLVMQMMLILKRVEKLQQQDKNEAQNHKPTNRPQQHYGTNTTTKTTETPQKHTLSNDERQSGVIRQQRLN